MSTHDHEIGMNGAAPSGGSSSPESLSLAAYHGRYDFIYEHYKGLDSKERKRHQGKYLLTGVVLGGIDKIRRGGSSDDEATVQGALGHFIADAKETNRYPRELFLSMMAWADYLRTSSRVDSSLFWYGEAEALGIDRYPDLHALALINRAREQFNVGRIRDAHVILRSLAERPYLVRDRNLLASAIFLLGQTSLLTGEAHRYHELLLKGIRHFSTDFDMRRLTVRQLARAHRHWYSALFDRHASRTDKGIYLAHGIEYLLHHLPGGQRLRLDTLARYGVLGLVYLINYGRGGARSVRIFSAGGREGDGPSAEPRRPRRDILITRVMGGIGDLLMMTPAIHELKRQRPDEEIHLAIPAQYFPVFEGNDDVKLVDIRQESLNVYSYRDWFNFTDCPAAWIESRTMPEVTDNRIDIFARALGISGRRFDQMRKLPLYHIREDERVFQETFWREHGLEGKNVVGVQYAAEEPYRDYPHIEALISALAGVAKVMLFHNAPIEGHDEAHIIKVDALPLRHAFALAVRCDVLVAPDSAFVHLAGALGIPCVGLYGPIDGKVRTAHYTTCRFIDARDRLPCIPCWWNENIPCGLTGRRDSACMENIGVDQVMEAVREMLSTNRPTTPEGTGPAGQPVLSSRGTVTAERSCKICGHGVRPAFSVPRTKLTGKPMPDGPDDCTYYECTRCGFCFTDLLDRADHVAVYGEEYWATQDPDWYGRVTETLRLVIMAASMVRREPWNLEILDFGCGMGTFVQTGREKLGMKVWGSDIIEPKFGKEYFLRTLPANRFDAAVACEVLEHLPFPVKNIQSAVRSLRPGGVFAFQTAYYDPETCGRDWWYVGPANGHISLYSPRSLEVLFRDLGGTKRLVWNDYAGVQAWQF